MKIRICVVASAALVACSAATAPRFSITPLTLDGPEYIRNDGFRSSTAAGANRAGPIRGGTFRYKSDGSDFGLHSWLYDGNSTFRIGLNDAEHTRDDGYQRVTNFRMTDAGHIVGSAYRYNGNDFAGESLWLYNGSSTVRLGFTGSEYTAGSGHQDSFLYDMNESGQVLGRSYRFNGGPSAFHLSSLCVFLYDGENSVNIGLTEGDYTRGDGFRWSEGYVLNEAGQATGISYLYTPGVTGRASQTAWLYNGTATIDIGLTDALHTRSDGFKFSEIGGLNEAGQVLGRSYAFVDGAVLNNYQNLTAWLYDGTQTIDIGLHGGPYTQANGNHRNTPRQLNQAGQAIGVATRFDEFSFVGDTAWLYDGAQTIPIGINDGMHLSASALELNAVGQVRGQSGRYNGTIFSGSNLGATAWFYDGTNTVEVGFTGPEYTLATGYRFSETTDLNDAGHVIGYSRRLTDSSGQDAWLYNGTTTIPLGFTDAEHTSAAGNRFSEAQKLNQAGQIIGYTRRNNGGQDAWFYDATLDQTFDLRLSTNSSTGYAFSTAAFLSSEEGLVLGRYTLFDDLGNNLGDRAFYFTIADGLHDLGALVEGGLAASGWSSLASGIFANQLGQILGQGRLTSQSGGTTAYILTPAVPEPSTAALAGLLVAMALLNRRRTA